MGTQLQRYYAINPLHRDLDLASSFPKTQPTDLETVILQFLVFTASEEEKDKEIKMNRNKVL